MKKEPSPIHSEIHQYINERLDALEDLIRFQTEYIRRMEAQQQELKAAHRAALVRCIQLEKELSAVTQ